MRDLIWRKSSRSQPKQADCVEVAARGAVRDSKNPDGGVLNVDVAALVAAVKANQIA